MTFSTAAAQRTPFSRDPKGSALFERQRDPPDDEVSPVPLEVINIGFGNVVIAARVVAVVRADSAPSRRMIEAASNDARLVDATSGRRTRSLIVTDSNHVLLSHMQPATIRDKLLGKRTDLAEEADDAGG